MRVLSWLLVALLGALLTGCAASPPPPPATTDFTRIDLPAGAAPTRLAAMGDALLIGVKKEGKPRLLRYADGKTTEIPLTPATGYGAEADWYSITTRGQEILAVGGRHGGAHGNVRWSVWRGTIGGVAEQPQTFSTFGGVGAGDLVDGVFPSSGPLVVGTWQSRGAGLDASLWTTDGTTWTRQSSTGTELESTLEALRYPTAAASTDTDVVIAGWQLVGGRQQPIVWTRVNGAMIVTPLPDAGRAGIASAVTCTDTCEVAGQVDGRLAVWRRGGNKWERVADVPNVSLGDKDRPPAPSGDTFVYSDRGKVHIGSLGRETRTARGPAGVVTAVTRVDDSTFVLAGPDNKTETLWRAD